MTICNDLRQAVLQAAIQGQLTEQLPTDSSVDKLLASIAAEKEELIKEKKIKKEKPLAPISEDEMPFDIPNSWLFVRLGSICRIIMGQSPDGNSIYHDDNHGIEFHQGKIAFTDEVIGASGISCSAPSKIAPYGSVLLCVRAPIGTVNITDRNICIGRGLCAVIPYGTMSVRFLLYLLRAHEDVFVKKGSGSTFKAITANVVTNQLVPLPPLEEQQRIVAKVEELMTKIDELEKTETELEAIRATFPGDMKAAVLQAAMQGKLTEQLDTDGDSKVVLNTLLEERKAVGKLPNLEALNFDDFTFPENWSVVKAGHCFSLLNGEKTSNVYLPYLEAKYLRGTKHVEYKTFGKLVRARDNVILVDGENSGEIFEIKEDGILGSTFKILFTPACMNKKFVLYFLEQYKPLLRNNKRGAAIPHLNKDIFNNLILPIPPIEEQDRIVEKIEKLLPLCEELNKEAV